MIKVCYLMTTIMRFISYKVLGRTVTDALVSKSSEKLARLTELPDHRTWFGGNLMILGSFTSLLRSRSIIEYGKRADYLIRNIQYILDIDVIENVPAFYECIKVKKNIYISASL